MSDEVTLAQLAAEMVYLRQQLEIVNQRLDMIYGAVTRLAETRQSSPPANAGHVTKPQTSPVETQPDPAPAATGNMLSAQMMMDPGSMLSSLHQYALNAGLNISFDTVDRLKSELPAEETKDEPD